jgi:hypothetical protein
VKNFATLLWRSAVSNKAIQAMYVAMQQWAASIVKYLFTWRWQGAW